MIKGTILGIDFSKEYTQIAYIDENGNPESISFGTEDNYLIPSVMCYHENLKEWYVGEEAVNKEENPQCKFFIDLPEVIQQQEEEKSYFMMQSYFSYLIHLAKKRSGQSVKNVLVTVEEVTPKLVEIISEALFLLGFEEEDFRVLSHSESFVYYMLNQNKDIWINQVYFFNFSKEKFENRRLKVIHGRGPSVAYVDVDDLSEMLTYDQLKENPKQADQIFAKYLEEKFAHQVVSGIYLSGDGFYEEDWAKSLSVMCGNRRVFKGNNLIVKGAAFAAKELFHIPNLENYLISCKGRTRVKVTMAVKYKERDNTITLSNVGDYWSQAKSRAECIMEQPTKAFFEVNDLLNQKKDQFELDLTGFPERPPKTTRIEVNFRYLDEKRFEIVIKDLGFGELFKSSGMEVSKIYEL
ncbi:MAG: hypothetical protein K6G85_08110 [Eubacterium sp.]|nr:hypothetical protein [Eubacterium sp.]